MNSKAIRLTNLMRGVEFRDNLTVSTMFNHVLMIDKFLCMTFYL